MYIQEIDWMDKSNKEAILKISDDMESMRCFSCPCEHNAGDVLVEPLECLDVEDIVVLHEMKESRIQELDGVFKYKFAGTIKNIEKGIVSVYGFDLHIDQEKFPGDVKEGTHVEFIVPRIDIW